MAKRQHDTDMQQKAEALFQSWREDWNKFIVDAFGVTLDREQRAIVTAVQHNKRVSVRSGTARGKDFVSACIALCFLYLTPRWNAKGELTKNTKVALTAPTDRQVKNIMMPEISRLFNRARKRGIALTGELTSYDIRTGSTEWFLTGFKADEHNHEAWSGFHAVNTMFIVTEATGIGEDTFEAIEGNLQGNSRILLVFNPNKTTGYAARSQREDRWARFCLNSLSAPNVRLKKSLIPGQVDFEWVKDKVENWCVPIAPEEASEGENDFEFDGSWYRPSDLFRKKVLGEFPKVDDDVLIPPHWIELAQKRWTENHLQSEDDGIMGVDVAGMGRDNSVFCMRYGNYVPRMKKHNSAGKAQHMAIAGEALQWLQSHKGCVVSIDTIGEGAGVYSRLEEECDEEEIVSCKFSEAARDDNDEELTDITGQYRFANMRAYLHWAVRDWLNPDNGNDAMLPPSGTLAEEAASIRFCFRSDGKIIIDPKDDIKKRLGHSPDEMDALCNTFHPKAVSNVGTFGHSNPYFEEQAEEEFEESFY